MTCILSRPNEDMTICLDVTPPLGAMKFGDLWLFDGLKNNNKEKGCFDKLQVINGDVSELYAGICEADRRMLQENVSAVFHVAATVRVDQLLSDVIKLNTRGTREIVELAKGMKKLEVFCHVSTAYTNVDTGDILKEKVIQHKANWKMLVEMVDNDEKDKLNGMVNELKGDLPNTYLFSKRLAEHVVYDSRHEIPTLIYRPSMVTSSVKEPFPGWVDNMASFSGVSAGVGKGVVRVHCGPLDVPYDFVPVDVTVNGMIIAAWKRANAIQNNTCKDEEICPVYNSTLEKCDINEMMAVGRSLWETHPMTDILWEPYLISCSNRLLFRFLFFLLHTIPGAFIDGLLKISGNKPRLLKIYDLLFHSLSNIGPLMYKTFKFETSNFENLKFNALPEDREIYWIENVKDRRGYITDNYHGIRTFIFREPKEVKKATLVHRQRVYWIDRITRFVLLGFILWILPFNLFFTRS